MTAQEYDRQLTEQVLLPIMFETLHREYGVSPRSSAEQTKLAQLSVALLAEHDQKQAQHVDRFGRLLDKAASRLNLPTRSPAEPTGEELNKAAALLAADKTVQPYLDAMIRDL